MGTLSNLRRRFWRDERGAALILVSVMLPVIIGFALLAIDMSRVNNLHNDLQKAADSFAMAGAAELDGRPDAIDRAERALEFLVDNTHRFSDTGTKHLMTSAADITWRFLKSLPADDATPIAAANITILPEEAYYIEVVADSTGFDAIFPASFLTGNAADNSMQIGARAVAGNAGAVVCEMTPMFICNPFPGESFHEVVNDGNFYRKSIKMVISGESWGPGNFGFLRPEDAHGYGEGELADDIAWGQLPECVSRRLVYTQTGNLTEKVKAGFNTRFDIYGPHFPKGNAGTPPPAPNIRKGFQYKPKGPNPGTDPCDMELATDQTQFRSLTRDTAFTGQIGNGMWDYEGYLAANGYSADDMAGFVDEEDNAYSNVTPRAGMTSTNMRLRRSSSANRRWG
ncbi:pilus assembly protein TadG-related protein (plasmid) [Mesorhizobium sp. AaZ16]|uniref:pilus assembly protein TadG-related protein n=1 Tax=Mesorhizobium sp. AaZ16 TaxID=3402289 RepID=UPI00374EFA71